MMWWTVVHHLDCGDSGDGDGNTNLTLQLDEDVIRRARIVAAKRGTSVSALVARELDGSPRRVERGRDRAWSAGARRPPGRGAPRRTLT